MKLVIDRSKWLRGEPKNSKLMRRGDGKMCCLGFLGLACGLRAEQMIGLAEPFELRAAGSKWPSWLVVENGDGGWMNKAVAETLMSINDADDLDGETRERYLTERFSEQGIEVEFVDGGSR